MRTSLLVAFAFLVAGCETAGYQPPQGFVTDQRIVYSDGLHNENTDMIVLDDRILLIFRGGETGQIGSDLAHINVYASMDGGQTFMKQSQVDTSTLPGMRDIRDPKLVEMNGTLFLYAISRLPGGHYRDLDGQAWTVRAQSTDHGMTWTAPVKTFADVDSSGIETFWGFWRFQKRTTMVNGVATDTLFALGYDDGDVDVGMFESPDGISWTKQSVVMSSYDNVPSEAELQFFGDDQQTAVAIVRMDNEGILQDGQSAICTSPAPFSTWECGRHVEQRLDGPKWLIDGYGRNFVVARKHLPCTDKRTAIYQLRGDLADPKASIEVCELAELTSAGDTSYTSLAALGNQSYLVSWYSTPKPATGDIPWLQGTYSPSDIWLANIDLSRAPNDCNPPPAKRACEPPALPSGTRSSAQSGAYLLTISPVIYPSQTLEFQATVSVHGNAFDLSLQPLDAMLLTATSDPWTMTDVPLDGDGRFDAMLGEQAVPLASFPLLADPLLELRDLGISGVFTSSSGFCGHVDGYAQVLGDSKADQIQLGGSTFGAVAITGGVLPAPVTSCSTP